MPTFDWGLPRVREGCASCFFELFVLLTTTVRSYKTLRLITGLAESFNLDKLTFKSPDILLCTIGRLLDMTKDPELQALALSVLAPIVDAQISQLSEDSVARLGNMLDEFETQGGAAASSLARDAARSIRLAILSRTWPTSGHAGSISEQTAGLSASDMTAIVKELRDPEVPARAYGLSQLRLLIRRSPSLSEQEAGSILQILCDHLQEDEEFVVMNAVKAVTSLVGTPRGLQCVLDRYRIGLSSTATDLRLKLGEALLQGIHASAKSKQSIPTTCYLDAVLSVLRNLSEPMYIKASALSLLGELLKQESCALRDQLTAILFVVLRFCAFGGPERTEPGGEEAHRGALLVVVHVLRCVGSDRLLLLGDRHLKEIATCMTQIFQCDPDPIARGHAEEALRLLG